ncbi:MAG: hypothetical protein LBS28_00265 [Streptococcaceae bacterium]|jgi:hypothetical protein|nr:hypothetical protein [Streptococcaceae bacterium]
MKNFNLRLIINKLIYGIFLFIMLVGISANITFLGDKHNYVQKAYWILLGAIVLIVIFRVIYGFLERLLEKKLTWLLVGIFFLYLLFEIYLLFAFTPSVIRDAFRMQIDALAFAKHQMPEWPIYYKMFAQNVLPTALYALAFRFLGSFLSSPLLIIKVVSFFLNAALFASLIYTITIVAKKKSVTVLMSLMLFCFPYLWTYNLWILYTDTPVMIAWTILACFFWRLSLKCPQKGMSLKTFAWWFLISMPFFFFAQMIKTSFLVSVAFAVVYLFVYLINFRKISWKIVLVTIGLCIVFIIFFRAEKFLQQKVHFYPDKQYAYPIEHWMSMGWHQISKGRFQPEDVKELKLYETIEEKKIVAQDRLKKRILEEKPRRIFWQLINKIGILLDGQEIYGRYYKGFQKAPLWFCKHAVLAEIFVSGLSKIALLVIYLLAFGKVWRAFCCNSPQLLVPVLIILSIVSFYSLLWEVGPRYGEVILGPLFLIVASPFVGKVQLKWKKKLSSVLFFSFGIFFISKILESEAKPVVIPNQKVQKSSIRSMLPVLGNSSNYVASYGRENLEIPVGGIISQKVVLEVEAYQQLQILRKQKQHGRFTLKCNEEVIFTTKEFDKEEILIKINRKSFKKGIYELIWENNKKYPIHIVAQKSPFYPLSEYPILGVKTKKDWYLIYSFNEKIDKMSK